MSGKYLIKDISRRLLGDMRGVLFDENAIEGRESEILYTVFRNIEIVEGKARYDITEIPARPAGEPAGNIGGEFNKTFGHLAINVGKETLKLANWMGFADYDYETYKKLHGGCYYVLDGGQTIEFEQNKNYKIVPELKKLKLKNSPALDELGIRNDKSHPIIDLKKHPEKLDWLAHPEKYRELLTIEKLYRKI